MQKIDADITLNFPFNWEYSIDNDTSWTAVNADIDVTILATDLPANKKIKIRSNDTNATRLGYLDDNNPRANISQESVHFDEINIRNCGTITNMNQFLKNTVCDKIIIQKTDNVTSLQECLSSTVSKFAYIDTLPNATNISSLFLGAVSKYVSPINVTTNSNTDTGSMFYGSVIGILGGVQIKHGYYGQYGAFRQLFYNANIKACGNIILNDYSNSGSMYYKFFYSSVFEKLPSCTLGFPTSSSDQYSSYSSAFYLSSSNKHNYFPSIKVFSNTASAFVFRSAFGRDTFEDGKASQLKFAGFDIDIKDAGANSFYNDYAFNSTKPIKGNFLAKVNANSIEFVTTSTNEYIVKMIRDNANNNKRWYYEDPDWFPVCRYLDIWANVTQVKNIKAVGYIKCQPHIYKVNGNNIEVHSSTEFSYGGVHDTLVSMSTVKEVYNNTSNVSTGIQGYTARQEGSDIKIYDKDNTLLSTISGVTFDSATFTWDGLKLYVVTGGTIDRAGNAGQNITNVVKVYEVATGNELNELTFLSTEADEYIVGCYQANDEYTLKVAKVKYYDNGGTYEFESAKVESYDLNNGNLLVDTEPVPYDFTLLTQDWIEENEFWLLDTRVSKGNCIRMVGK